MKHRITVAGVPDWVPVDRLLDDGAWERADGWQGVRDTAATTDLLARLRGVWLDGTEVVAIAAPKPKRNAVRAARTEDARRRRDTSPGFRRKGVRLDAEGRVSLTPEDLAQVVGQKTHQSGHTHVIDACCGCGGNAIGFARAGLKVTAIERDPGRLAMARHNAGVYGVADRIDFVAGDAFAVLPGLDPAALLFVDPPWGHLPKGPILAQDLPLLGLARAPCLVKVPAAFATASFEGVPRAWFGLAGGDRRRVKFVTLERS